MDEAIMHDPEVMRAVNAGIKAVENQAKLAEAAMIAARAFEKLVGLIEIVVKAE
jgi:hypothetical protein